MDSTYSFLQGGGEMNELTRSFDWSQTVLGSPDTWPQSLRTTLSIVLNSKFPMFLFWGPELLCFYNDAYRPSLGQGDKHPFALGRPAKQVWPEIWPIISPQIEQVLSSGEATWHPNSAGAFYRNGRLDLGFWTYSYSPVRDEAGRVAGVFVTCMETTQQVLNHRQIEASEATLQNAVGLAELGTWSFDCITGLVTLSPRMADWFGLDQLQADIDSFIAQVVEEERTGVRNHLFGLLEPGSDGIYDVVQSIINAQTGRKRIIRALGKAHYDADGKPLCINGTAQDITRQRELQLDLENEVQKRTQEIAAANQEIRQFNEQLQSSINDLKRSNDNLQQFAYVASHDLQEPLRKIQSFSDLLSRQLGEEVSEQSKDYLDRIVTAGDRMSTLIKDLLSYSRIATRQQAFGLISLKAIMAGVFSTLDWEIQQSQARISVDELPMVNGDESQLGQLFQNLMTNALKFVQPGQMPQIHIQYVKRALNELPLGVQPIRQTPYYHQISVKDEGIGFDMKYADRIFQVFQRLHGRNQFPGTGVGLAICQRVVDNHGGAISADSKPGEGATFYVYLPA